MSQLMSRFNIQDYSSKQNRIFINQIANKLALLVGFSTVLILTGCASPAKLSENTLEISRSMSLEKADVILSKYVKANDSRGGACLVGFNPGASLDYSKEVFVKGAKINFTGRFGEGQFFGKTFLPDTKIEALKPQFSLREVSVDAKSLKEIRVIDRNIEGLKNWCPNVKPNYLVVLKPETTLPSDAELSINVGKLSDLEMLLATLVYLSPDARLVGGSGM